MDNSFEESPYVQGGAEGGSVMASTMQTLSVGVVVLYLLMLVVMLQLGGQMFTKQQNAVSIAIAIWFVAMFGASMYL